MHISYIGVKPLFIRDFTLTLRPFFQNIQDGAQEQAEYFFVPKRIISTPQATLQKKKNADHRLYI